MRAATPLLAPRLGAALLAASALGVASEACGTSASSSAPSAPAGPTGGAGSCTEALAFTPCGGDIKGAWAYELFCPSLACQTECVDRFGGACAGYSADTSWQVVADVTITETEIQSARGLFKTIVRETVPLSCFASAGDGGAGGAEVRDCRAASARLAASADAGAESACADEASGVCRCTSTVTEPQAAVRHPYTTSGTILTITGESGEVTKNEYCVKDGRLFTRDVSPNRGVLSSAFVLRRR